MDRQVGNLAIVREQAVVRRDCVLLAILVLIVVQALQLLLVVSGYSESPTVRIDVRP
jgi:hypothetical protein